MQVCMPVYVHMYNVRCLPLLFSFIFWKIFFFVCMCLWAGAYWEVPVEASREGIGFPGTEVTGNYELSAENQTWDFWKKSKHSELMSSLQLHPFYILRQGLSLNLEVINRLAGQQAIMHSPSLAHPQMPCQAFYVDNGTQHSCSSLLIFSKLITGREGPLPIWQI